MPGSRRAVWPYAAIASPLAGPLGFTGYGYWAKQVEAALARGDYAPFDDRAAVFCVRLARAADRRVSGRDRQFRWRLPDRRARLDDRDGRRFLLTPILVIFFGFKPTLAVGTDILHGAIFKSFGAVRHRRLGTVHARLTFWMFLGSGPMSLLGVATATWIKNHYGGAESVESYAVGVALIIGGIGLVAKTFIKRGVQPSDAPFLLQRRDRIIAFCLGAVCGFIVGLTSVGSGTFFGLVMVLVFPLTLPKIVGTDIFHAAALLWVAGFGHLVAGNVDLRTMAWLLTGSIPGILLTSKLTLRIPDGCGWGSRVPCADGIKLIDFSGADWVIGRAVAGLGIFRLVAGRPAGPQVAPRAASRDLKPALTRMARRCGWSGSAST